ncbi:MAG: ribonuclease R [Robiginitomaculum sp.]|nr:MAG: ribonuclease R [Robiginitomaculum sp.]
MKITRDTILKTVRETSEELTKRGLVRALGLSGDQRRELRLILSELTEDGTLIRTDRRTYRCSGTLPRVMAARIDHIDDQGDLIAVPVKWEGKSKPPHIIVFEKMRHKKSAVHANAKLGIGDRALLRIEKRGDVFTGEVIKTLGEGPQTQLGVVVKGGRGWRIRPVAKGSRYDHLPARGQMESLGLKDQDLVLFELSDARHKGDRIARISEVLGSANHPRSASIISLYAHNIPLGFSSDELAEASKLSLPALSKTRQDIRDVPLITIDPDDAKDFDDAIFASPDDSPKNIGGHIVWVAIADVSVYVRPGSALDKGAFKRGNSVYLPDRVEPMLPEELSADLCSLRPNEDRACLAVRMRFNAEGDKIGHKFVRGIMRSHARLTYSQAQTVFKPEGKTAPEALAVEDILKDLYAAYESVKIARERRGPLEIDVPERRVRVDEKGNVISIEVRERFDAHMLVEEFMIQANVSAAQALDAKNAELIYRVHEGPSHEKIQGLSDFLPALGLKWSMGERITPKRFNRLIDSAREKDLAETVSMSVLRTQMQAYYGPKNGGHFGLNLTHYAHFTSPIRRYADLIVHRALISAYTLGDDGISTEEVSRLKEISEHISNTERRAMAAERDSKDRYIAAYLQDRIGAEFEGRIAGVTRAGMFIQLDETGADGFCPVSRLGVERYIFDEKTKSLIGVETGGTYKFGRRVKIRLLEATPLTGGLIFEMLTDPEQGKRPKNVPPSHYRNRTRPGGPKRGSFKGKNRKRSGSR